MLEAAQHALLFAQGRSRIDLEVDAMFRRATIHCLQEIGEAAAQVDEPTRLAIPQLPWKQIVGMRHRLVHVYFAINLDLVWEVVVRDLPPLVEAVEAALADSGDEPISPRSPA